MELEGKSALVTGAASGIGKGIAFKLAEAGASVAVADIHEEAAQEAVKEFRKSITGASAIAVQAGVSAVNDVKNMVTSVKRAFGRIDILVNNAGIAMRKYLLDLAEDDWERTIAINLNSMFYCCKYVVPEMLKQGKGKIVNISSIAAITGFANARSAYCASKGGVNLFTRTGDGTWTSEHIRECCCSSLD